MLGDALEPFRRKAAEKHVELEAWFDAELSVTADPVLTRSALENLLDHAVKYTDAGVVRLEVEDRPDAVAFHVRDSCAGLSEAQLRVIFEPFKRAHSTKPGTGLGLAITRREIEVQGGALHAESSGSGCHFWFELPY